MSSKRKKPAAPAAKKPSSKSNGKSNGKKPVAQAAALAPDTCAAPDAHAASGAPAGMSKKQKSMITRFAVDLADQYGRDNVNATVYKIRRALWANREIYDTIITYGSRVWLQKGFNDAIEKLIDELPDTTFRQPLTEDEKRARREAQREALLRDVEDFDLRPETIKVLRHAYARGFDKNKKAAAKAEFDAVATG